ncbi:MAG TPA: 2-dehydropantoate 2-reductase [Acidimicrobiales bacterium]|nr:2-dehydropantoate 2-reductase [Acidimicrobiales bacterium]
MRFVIYGAGGVGGVVGGRLHQAGHDVVLVARGDHLAALQRDGLTLRSPVEDVVLPIPAVGSPGEAELRSGDVVVLAMKSQHTADAVAELVRVAPPDLAVACAQNGLENERVALRSFADVYAVVVMLPATHLAPGTVEAWSTPVTGLLDVGRYPSGVDATAEAIAGAFRSATFDSVARSDVMRWKVRKLILNLGNAVEAVAGEPARATPLLERAVAEAEAVLDTAGVDRVSHDDDVARRGDLMRMRRIGGQRRPGGSSWQSLARGLDSIETDYLNGEIVLLGRLHGVPTPVNALLQRLARTAAASGRPPGAWSADEVLAMDPG